MAVNFVIARREFWHQRKFKADAHKSKHSVHFISTATHSAEHWLAAATRLGPASEWSGGAMPRPGGSGRAPVRRGNPSRGCCFEVFLPLQPATPEPVSWGPHLLLTQAAKPAMIQTYWNLHPPLRLCSDKVWRSSYIQSSSPGIVSSVIWPHRWFGHSLFRLTLINLISSSVVVCPHFFVLEFSFWPKLFIWMSGRKGHL